MSGEELRASLGEEVADVLEKLSEDEAAELSALYRAAVAEQRAAMVEAQERSLRLIPALLRGPVRKVLGG